jgi:hypothetical protein
MSPDSVLIVMAALFLGFTKLLDGVGTLGCLLLEPMATGGACWFALEGRSGWEGVLDML